MICLPPAKNDGPDPAIRTISIIHYSFSVFIIPMPYPFTEPAVTPSIR